MKKDKVKNILFRVKLKGNGIVNFDSSEQKWVYNGTTLNHMKTMHDNTSYAKKNFYKGADDKVSYKLKISADCLRHEIFAQDAKFQNPNLIYDDALMYSFIASPCSLLRGYMFANTMGTFKRKGPFSIVDAEQTCDAVSFIETFARSGAKNTDAEKVDNSFFKKETVGNIEYEAFGNIDLMQLQFVSTDLVFDRLAFNPDKFVLYSTFLRTKLPGFNSDLNYYQMKDSVVQIPEYGFKLTSENSLFLVKELFKRLLSLNIVRKSAVARAEQLEYKLVYDAIEDTYENEDGWVSVNKIKDVDNMKFDIEDFYVEYDEAKALKMREGILAAYEKNKKFSADKKADKAAAVKESKAKTKVKAK